jgi:hypothetical protein
MTTLSGAAATSEQMPATTASSRRRRVLVITAAATITVVVVALAMRPTRSPEVVAHPAAPAVREPVTATTPPSTPPPSASPPSASPPSAPLPSAPPPSAPLPSAPPPSSSTKPTSRDAAQSATIDVVVETTPAGADVVLNGNLLGKTPYRGAQSRRNGDVTLVLKLRGYADRTITVRSDQAIRQRIELVKVPARNIPKRDQSVNPF